MATTANSGALCDTYLDVDVNSDRLADVVVPEPHATVAGVTEAGRVLVYYGGGKGAQVISQNTRGVPGTAEAGDRFGNVTAVTDLNGDGCQELSIAAADEDLGGTANAGGVWFVPGGTNGLDLASTSLITQNSSGVPGTAEAGDRFGGALAGTVASTGGILAVGVPGENGASGAVYVMQHGNVWAVTQDSAGVAGEAEPGDRYGEVLTALHGVVVVGVPHEDIGGIKDAGIVQYLGPTATSVVYVRTVSQNSPGVSGTPESGDRFGASLDTDRAVPRDEASEPLAIGVPGESLTSADADHGMVHLLIADGLAPEYGYVERHVHQNTAGVLGVAEATDQFGEQVNISSFRLPGDDFDQVALTVVSPHEYHDAEQGDIPAIQAFLLGSDLGAADQWAKQNSYGLPADAELTTAYAEGRDDSLYLEDASGAHVYAVPWGNVFSGRTDPVLAYTE
jgi:hypothetical protein